MQEKQADIYYDHHGKQVSERCARMMDCPIAEFKFSVVYYDSSFVIVGNFKRIS